MRKLDHLDLPEQAYFLTTTTVSRQPVFQHRANASVLWGVINRQRERGRFYLLAFVIMPDHLHLVVMPREETRVSFIMQEIKKGSSRLINRLGERQGKLWLDDYYDHAIRMREELVETLKYVHCNPVKRGLVGREEAYPFSSANPRYRACLWLEW